MQNQLREKIPSLLVRWKFKQCKNHSHDNIVRPHLNFVLELFGSWWRARVKSVICKFDVSVFGLKWWYFSDIFISMCICTVHQPQWYMANKNRKKYEWNQIFHMMMKKKNCHPFRNLFFRFFSLTRYIYWWWRKYIWLSTKRKSHLISISSIHAMN